MQLQPDSENWNLVWYIPSQFLGPVWPTFHMHMHMHFICMHALSVPHSIWAPGLESILVSLSSDASHTVINMSIGWRYYPTLPSQLHSVISHHSRTKSYHCHMTEAPVCEQIIPTHYVTVKQNLRPRHEWEYNGPNQNTNQLTHKTLQSAIKYNIYHEKRASQACNNIY